MIANPETNREEPIGNLVMSRPDIKVHDCTVRDGGLMNSHQFSFEFVKAAYQACVAAGVDYFEIGYRNDRKQFSSDEFGPWKFSDEEDVRKVVGENKTDMVLSVMADAGKSDMNDIPKRSESVIGMVRVAAYIHQIPTALEMIQDAHEKGYETAANIMSVSKVSEKEIEDALGVLARSKVDVIYVVDSFGSLYPEQTRRLTKVYCDAAKPAGKEVGIHAHNNQALAFANTTESLIYGASRADGSLAGLGRGAGNCQMELLVGFLRNPKFNLRPLIEVIQDHVEPMRKKLKWGFDIPYLITGLLNDHPRAAMKLMEAKGRKDFVKFYDEVTTVGW